MSTSEIESRKTPVEAVLDDLGWSGWFFAGEYRGVCPGHERSTVAILREEGGRLVYECAAGEHDFAWLGERLGHRPQHSVPFMERDRSAGSEVAS